MMCMQKHQPVTQHEHGGQRWCPTAPPRFLDDDTCCWDEILRRQPSRLAAWGHSWGHGLRGARGILFNIWGLYDLFEGPRPTHRRPTVSVGLFVSANSSIPAGLRRILRALAPSPHAPENAPFGGSSPIFRPIFSEKFGKLLAVGPRSSHSQSSRYACVAESRDGSPSVMGCYPLRWECCRLLRQPASDQTGADGNWPSHTGHPLTLAPLELSTRCGPS